MTLYLYNLLVDPRTVDKSVNGALSPVTFLNLDQGYIATGTLRDRCSIVDPVFTLELDNSNVGKFNYLYAVEWGRYYFVRETVVERTGLVTAYCHVDVLYTYKTSILNLSAYVERNETNAKPFLPDAKRPLSQDVTHTVITPSSGTGQFSPVSNLASRRSFVGIMSNFPGIPGSNSYTNDDPNRIYPGVAHVGNDTGTIGYSFTHSEMDAFFQEFYNTNWSAILNSLVGNSTDAITDIISYPFTLDDAYLYGANPSQAIQLCNHAMTAQAYKLIANPYKWFSFGSFKLVTGSFVEREPYTRATMYLPYVGEIEIPMFNLNNGVTVKYQVSLMTGECVVSITDDVTGVYVHTARAQIGIHIPITKTNNVEQARNGLLTGMQSLGGLSQDAGQSLSVMGNSLVKMGLNTLRTTTGRPANETGRMLRYDPYVLVEKTVDLTPVNYGHFVGYPLESVATLSTLSGFTVVGEVFGHIADEMEDEHDEIMRLLKSGVIL